VSTPPQVMMDVLYMQNSLQVLGVFTRNSEPTPIEATAAAFVDGGFRLCMPVYTTFLITSVSEASGIATLVVQLQQGDLPAVGVDSSPALVQHTTADSGSFNTVPFPVTISGLSLLISGAGSLTYTTTATGAGGAGGSVVLVPPTEVIEVEIPANLIGMFQANFSLSALTQPTDFYASAPPGPPSPINQFTAASQSSVVIVTTNPLTIQSPVTGQMQILYRDEGSGAIIQASPISISTANAPIPVVTPTTLSTTDNYRAIVFVPGCPIAVSGSFTG
jgi:hypothetical protein